MIKNMKLEDVASSSKAEIFNATGFFRDSDESPGNIDLGIHKYDDETMAHILDNVTKYYYLIDIAPTSLLCELVANMLEAIKTTFDTKTFMYDVVDALIKTGHIDSSDSDENYEYRSFLLKNIPKYEEHFDYILQVFDAPENQECLHTDIENDRYELKQYDIDEVWKFVEMRDLHRKLESVIPSKPIEKKTKLKI